jgi:CRP/FNR family transcriptional regulator, cyclic AMP receptor protein
LLAGRRADRFDLVRKGEEPGGEKVTFLASLSAEEAADLRARGVTRSYPRGTALFHERQNPDRVVVILAGRVKLSCLSEEGRETVLAIRETGELLGELSAIDEEPRSATATALDAVEALVVPAGDFTAFLEEHPRVALTIMRTLTRRLRDADRKRAEFGAQDTMGRVAARLVELSSRFGKRDEDGVRIDLPISQEELAGWTGCSRETVSKALKAMRDLGWIDTRRRRITLLDEDAVRRRAA